MHYFLHLPKTAGTSLLSYLRQSIPPERLFEVYQPITSKNCSIYCGKIQARTCFYGHYSFGFHALWDDEAPRYVTVLRNPTQRVVSFYRYCLRQPDHPMHPVIVGMQLSLHDFVAARVTGETNNVMVRALAGSYRALPILQDQFCNLTSRALTGRPFRRCPSRKLAIAIRNLDRFFIHVGHVDGLQETAEFLLSELGCIVPATKVGRENADEDALVEIDPNTRRLIENENELDLELYDRVSRQRPAWRASGPPPGSHDRR